MVFEFQRLTAGFYHSDFSLVSSIELSDSLSTFVVLSSRSVLSRIELSTPAIPLIKFRQSIW